MVDRENVLRIIDHYEACLARHGDSHLGVDWPKLEDTFTRHAVMLDVVRPQPRPRPTLLDVGCGASHLYDYMLEQGMDTATYHGLDLSEAFIQLSRKKHPDTPYYCFDLLKEADRLPSFDYIIMNGVFTEKLDWSYEDFFTYFCEMLRVAFSKVRVGMAFNVMSKVVDWERKDLFHLSYDTLAHFLSTHLSRHFIIRNDYGLYEYTTYVYK